MHIGRLALICAVMTAAPGAAFADSSCDKVLAALLKGTTVASRATIVMHIHETKPDSDTTAAVQYEVISANSKMYSKDQTGEWVVDDGESASSIKANWTHQACTANGTETVSGEATDVFSTHFDSEKPFDIRYWISDSSGLVLKSETLINGAVIDATMDYQNVQVPPVGSNPTSH